MPQEKLTRSAEMRERQRAKISELRAALIAAGFFELNQQSEALGLARSTTWAVLKASHKGSGLSAQLINRMFDCPKLPPEAQFVLVAYVEERLAGFYGHSPAQLEKFRRQLAAVHRTNSVPTERRLKSPATG